MTSGARSPAAPAAPIPMGAAPAVAAPMTGGARGRVAPAATITRAAVASTTLGGTVPGGTAAATADGTAATSRPGPHAGQDGPRRSLGPAASRSPAARGNV